MLGGWRASPDTSRAAGEEEAGQARAAGPGCPALATHPLRPQPSSPTAHNSEKMQKVATLKDRVVQSLLMRFLHFEEIEDVYCQCGAWRYACTDSRRMPRGERPPLWPLTLAGRPMRARGRVASPSFSPLASFFHLLRTPPPLPPTCKRRCYQMASPPSASKGTLLESLISDGSALPPCLSSLYRVALTDRRVD